VVVPYETRDSASSFVVHVIVAPLGVTALAATPEITGGVVSAVNADVKVALALATELPAASWLMIR
jgi:hypothetical protein